MGFLHGLIGNASEVDVKELQAELTAFLIEDEAIETAFKLIRDYFVFTNKRLILIDKQGVTGKKVEYTSIPYHSIGHFSIETAGHFDLDSEMKLWIKGHPHPITKDFKKGSNIEGVQKTLAHHIFSTHH